MKILWIANVFFPDLYKELNLPVPFQCGWVYSGAQNLISLNKGLQIAIASTYEGKTLQAKTINGVNYFLIPHSDSKNNYSSALEGIWKEVAEQFKPDVVHIHGTEYPFTYAYIKACGAENVVQSIQGLVSVYQRYYFGGIEKKTLRKNISLRDRVRFDTIFKQQLAMKKRGYYETESIKNANHIIGRTSWDKAHTWAINPECNYYFCNETLRSKFYDFDWSGEACEKYSIFVSQGNYPIKGLHQMLHALPFILRHFPETKLYVAGADFITGRGIRINGFGKYINALIKKNNLKDKVIFTGPLAEEEMCRQFLRSHVFVSPSSIENSPNSIGEAQLIGVPCVASYVGGVSDMIDNNETGLLYRFEETEMLAAAVCRVFSDKGLVKKLSAQGKEAARLRHNKTVNAKTLHSIYEQIVQHTSSLKS